MALNADGFIGAWVVMDSHRKVWMAWGKTLASYDPIADSVQTWHLPTFAGLNVHLNGAGLDGNIVALTIDAADELWVAVHRVPAVFGFSSVADRWDRTLKLPWFPFESTRLASIQRGVIAVNGARSSDGKVYEQKFAKIDTASGRLTPLPLQVLDYAVVSSNEAVYVDLLGNIDKLNLSSGATTTLVLRAPVNGNAGLFAADSKGNVWFSMLSFRNVGIAELNLTTGALTRFPFPYVVAPGSPMPDDCPPATVHCVPSGAVFDAGIQAIALDSRENVWVVTQLPGSHDPNTRGFVMTPVVELKLSTQ